MTKDDIASSLSAKKLHEDVVKSNRDFYDENPEVLFAFNEASRNSSFEQYLRHTLKSCIGRIGPVKGRKLRILDVGTGQGHLLGYLTESSPGAHLEGVDVSRINIDIAKARHPEAQFFLRDFVNDFTPVAPYDLITAYSVLHHIVNWREFLDKATSCLAPGGVLYLDHDPLRGHLTQLYGVLWRLKHRHNLGIAQMEYHALVNSGISHTDVKQHLQQNFHVELTFSNVGLFQEIFKLTGFNAWNIIPAFYKTDNSWKNCFRHFFLDFKVIAQHKL